jgi:hypothetical protein
MKHHADYSVMIQLFIDDELTNQEREDFFSHSNNCVSCQKELEEAKAFSTRVREARLRVEAPSALREKILNHMIAPGNQSNSDLLVQKRPGISFYWRPLAAAAVFLIMGVFD